MMMLRDQVSESRSRTRAAAAMVRLLDSNTWSQAIEINSNCYLSNGVVLRAV